MDKDLIRQIKSRFFAMRNGDIADRLRKAGSPYKIIFGLLVPQMEQIAASVEHSVWLAEELWSNTSTRESRILATMIYPTEEFTLEKAGEYAESADTQELVDMLCFRLVRNIPCSERLISRYSTDDRDLLRYFALRLAMNLLVLKKAFGLDSIYTFAKSEFSKANPMTRRIAFQVIDEIDFLRDATS